MGFCGSKADAMSVKKGALLNTCFVDVLNMVPHALLALICIFILTVWNHSVMGKIQVKTWVHLPGHNLRWIATLALLFINIVQIAEGVISDSYDPDTVNYHTFIPQCIATIGTIVSIVFYHNVEQWNSPKFLLVLMVYWPSAIILKVLKAFSLYKNDLTMEYLKPWLLWFAILAYLVIFAVELHAFRVQRYYFFKRPRLRQPPEDLEHTRYTHSYVNFLSKAVFWWITDLMIEGYKHPIQSEDLGRLPESEQAQTQFKKLMFAFEEEKFKATQQSRAPSLFKSYLRAFWPMLLLAALFRFLGDSLSFVGPVIIQYIVDYAYDLTDPEFHAKNSTLIHGFPYVTVEKFMWNGYVLAVVLFLATVLQNTLLQNHNYLVYREGIRLKTAIQMLVYDKALRMSTMVLNQGRMTIGQIMNHMIVDSMFLMHLFFFIHYVWSIPFQMVVALILLYSKLGVSAVIGGMFVVLCGPILYAVGIAMSRLQKKVLLHSDVRVKKVSELLSSIKTIKLLSLEDVFANNVEETRQKELKQHFPLLIIRALIGFLGMAAPTMGAMITFIIYPYIESTPLTAGRTFSTLALFNVLSTPLVLLTIFVASFANAKVAGSRLVPYLLAQEVKGTHHIGTRVQTHNVAIDTEEDRKESKVQYDVQTGLPLTTLSKDEAFCSSQSSLGSHISHTPGHSRQNSGTSLLDMFESKRLSLTRNSSSEYLSVKPLTLVRKSSAPLIGTQPETTADRRRKRNHSGFSTEDEDDIADENLLIELRSVLEISQGNFSWELENTDALCLKNVNIKIPLGKLTVIVGPVGSGKSSLLAAMLGEMVTISGIVEWKRDTGISYAGQRPWLMNASLRDNVLFGNPYIWRRYKKVISACSLQPDIDTLMSADLTEIGEKGVTLSGGQKQRVGLARAIYADADTVILDDPFSALDAHVGRHVFEEAIMRRLIRRKRTVILVTHQLQYIGHAAQVIVMKDGEVQYHGRPADVKKYDQDLYESWRKAVKEYKPLEAKVSKEPEFDHERKSSWSTERPASVQSNLSLPMFSRQVSRSQMSVMTEASNEDRTEEELGEKHKLHHDDTPDDANKLLRPEHREEGAVVALVYLYYFRACCIALCVLTVVLQVLHHALMVSANFSLSVWASDANRFEQNLTHHPPPANATRPTFDSTPYVITYAALAFSAIFGALIAALVLYFTGLQGARVVFSRMLHNVIHLRMRFFDTNPSGRILNRFTADVNAVDMRLYASLESLMRCFLYTVAAIIVNSITTPFFIIAAVPLVLLYYFLQKFFRNTARELQRLDSVTKSPVFAHFGETLEGLQTIRAYRCEKAFRRKAFATIDSNVAPFLYIHTINRWLGIRLDYLGCLLVFVSAVASLSAGALGKSNPAFIGLCITYALMISGLLNWLVRMTTEVEMNMNAVERIREYSEMDTELSTPVTGGVTVSETWPEKGVIEFNDVSLRYDELLDDVVNDVTLSIKAGEKIGICGRTGSGKSSLALSLFRLLEISSGEITIDGTDIAKVDLSVLRSRLSIIPQDPVLFNGTVRYNLDPKGDKQDEALWSALDAVHMRDTVTSLAGQLDGTVSAGGENFSVGQRQLLCLARAFLRDSRIVILDEATASVDLETDAKLQQIVHEDSFKDKTVLTIAHRISTIAAYDRVMVLDKGRLEEFDRPSNLLENEDSLYTALVEETNKQH